MDTVILGVGGHARVLLAALSLRGIWPRGCIAPSVPDASWPSDIAYLGDDARLAELDPEITGLINAVGSTRATALRRKVFERAKELGHHFAGVVHPSAVISKDTALSEGIQVMAGAVVQTGAVLESNVLINTGAIVDHDCRIGAHAHIAIGARLSGGVHVGCDVHIGTGACLLQGVRIGNQATIGAGAVVIADVAAGTTVVGNPARALPRGNESRPS